MQSILVEVEGMKRVLPVLTSMFDRDCVVYHGAHCWDPEYWIAEHLVGIGSLVGRDCIVVGDRSRVCRGQNSGDELFLAAVRTTVRLSL